MGFRLVPDSVTYRAVTTLRYEEATASSFFGRVGKVVYDLSSISMICVQNGPLNCKNSSPECTKNRYFETKNGSRLQRSIARRLLVFGSPITALLNDLKLRNSPNRCVISLNSVAFGADYVKEVEDTRTLSASEM